MYKNLLKLSHKLSHILTGFSLVELLITVAIISILASVAIPNYQEYRTKVMYNNSMNMLNQNTLAINKYYSINNKSCPAIGYINKTLNSSYYFGTTITNDGCSPSTPCCNLQLLNNSVVQITLTADTTGDKFIDGIKYTCNINSALTDTEKTIIKNYLPDCT